MNEPGLGLSDIIRAAKADAWDEAAWDLRGVSSVKGGMARNPYRAARAPNDGDTPES